MHHMKVGFGSSDTMYQAAAHKLFRVLFKHLLRGRKLLHSCFAMGMTHRSDLMILIFFLECGCFHSAFVTAGGECFLRFL